MNMQNMCINIQNMYNVGIVKTETVKKIVVNLFVLCYYVDNGKRIF